VIPVVAYGGQLDPVAAGASRDAAEPAGLRSASPHRLSIRSSTARAAPLTSTADATLGSHSMSPCLAGYHTLGSPHARVTTRSRVSRTRPGRGAVPRSPRWPRTAATRRLACRVAATPLRRRGGCAPCRTAASNSDCPACRSRPPASSSSNSAIYRSVNSSSVTGHPLEDVGCRVMRHSQQPPRGRLTADERRQVGKCTSPVEHRLPAECPLGQVLHRRRQDVVGDDGELAPFAKSLKSAWATFTAAASGVSSRTPGCSPSVRRIFVAPPIGSTTTPSTFHRPQNSTTRSTAVAVPSR
jgi:hypothetical protein